MPKKEDLAIGEWVVDYRDRLKAASKEVAEGKDPLTAYAWVSEAGPFTPQDIVYLINHLTYFQVLNDLHCILDKAPSSSETVQFLRANSQIGADSRVADFGSSCGRHLWELLVDKPTPQVILAADINLIALAIGAKVWEQARPEVRPHWCCADILKLPFKDGSFTQVQSFGTVSLVPVRAALAELYRVLAPGERLILTAEGVGLWRQSWDHATGIKRRLNLLRCLAGGLLLRWGIDWQRNRFTRRLAGFTQFTPNLLQRLVHQPGFKVEKCEVLREYKGQPWIIGIVACKPVMASP
jgi:SAM-dependent methyltransferase